MFQEGDNYLTLSFDPGALDILRSVNQYLSTRQIPAYLVGGFVRDSLIGRFTADIDIAVDADGLKLAAEMAGAIGGKFVPLDAEHKIARIVLQEIEPRANNKSSYIDVSSLQGDIIRDLGRRDFTIDALAIDLKKMLESPEAYQIIDPTGGQEDLGRRLVKAVNDTVFQADPLRLLRAVRLSAELDFAIANETENLISRDCRLISLPAGERVREELLHILATDRAAKAVRLMDNLGLLTAVFAELEPARGVEQPQEHHWDVLNHSLETVAAVEFLLRRGPWPYSSKEVLQEVPWSEQLETHFDQEISHGSTRALLIKLAALLHDIAKPETKIIANGRLRFFGHNEQGAVTSRKILERLRFTHKENALVELMVRYHLRPTQMSHEQALPTKRAIYRYFRDTGAAGIDIIFLSLADHLAARGPDLDAGQWKWHAAQSNFVLAECFQNKEIIAPAKFVDGHDLMSLFGLKPGPRIRSILEAVREAQADGVINGRDEALSYIKNRLL